VVSRRGSGRIRRGADRGGRPCGEDGIGRPHQIRWIYLGLSRMWFCVCNETPLGFGAARQVFDAGPKRDGGAVKPHRRREGSTAGRHVPWRVVGAPKALFGEGKERPWLISSAWRRRQSPARCAGTQACSVTQPGVAMAGEAACEGKRRRARTPNLPGVSSTRRKAIRNSEASARGRNARERGWD
jgi:hypothetical protein